MDTNQLIAHSRARFEHASTKRLLKEKYQAKLNFAYNGGMFCATPEMIAFLSLYEDQQIVVKDLYENPVEVQAQELRDIVKGRLQEQMNAWLAEYNEIKKNR